MTRPFNAQYHCPNCRTFVSCETMFGRWIRENKELESKNGYCVTDQDYWIHKFKTFGGRDFQLLMGVEIKTMGQELTMAQTDTLHTINQLLRNRRQTPTKELKWQATGSCVRKVKSVVAKKEVVLRAYGIHVLTFSGLGPNDSEWMAWDRKPIDIKTLTQLLRFDLDPDTLSPLDLRNHHIKSEEEHVKQLVIPLTMREAQSVQ